MPSPMNKMTFLARCGVSLGFVHPANVRISAADSTVVPQLKRSIPMTLL